MNKNIERNILKNTEYIISFFKEKNHNLTNLEVQKLSYFLEAIYMVCTNDNYLYQEDFYAWNFGPVNDIIYNRYKTFGSFPIDLKTNVDINPENLKYIEMLYNLFKDFNATQLVNLSHIKGSPWYDIYERWNGAIPENEVISKKETKIWFESLVDIE